LIRQRLKAIRYLKYLLRFNCEDNYIRLFYRFRSDFAKNYDTEFLLYSLKGICIDFYHSNFFLGLTIGKQSPDDRLRHVAAADESDVHASSFIFESVRVPKITVPTRTSVAPSAIATSKSPDMPIDKVSSGMPPAMIFSCSFLNCAK